MVETEQVDRIVAAALFNYPVSPVIDKGYAAFLAVVVKINDCSVSAPCIVNKLG